MKLFATVVAALAASQTEYIHQCTSSPLRSLESSFNGKVNRNTPDPSMLTRPNPSVSAHTTTQDTTCAAPTATTTQIVQSLRCGRILCRRPSRTCADGEPTQPEARPPFVFNTVTPEPGACTAVAEAIYNPGCNLCPTCLASVAAPTVTRPVATPTPTVQI